MIKLRLLGISLLAASVSFSSLSAEEYDVVIYGGTMAGITAAIQAKRMGKTVALVEPSNHLGGLTTGGLGATDFGKPNAIEGLAREFYQNIYNYYLDPKVWKNETREEYVLKHGDAVFEKFKLQFFFEPSVAQKLVADMLKEADVPVFMNEPMKRPGGVEKSGARITSLLTESGKKFSGKTFIDSTYEGDLMAEAGVTNFIGREAQKDFNESLAGVRTLSFEKTGRQSAYREPGNPASGLLPGIEPKAPGAEGDGDHRLQAYNYRVCLTDDPENMVAVAKPEGYNREWYELLSRFLQWRPKQTIGPSLIKLTPMPNRKTDSNNQGAFSTDFVGYNYDWPTASYADRKKLAQKHTDYVQGFIWFLQNDESVPEDVRAQMKQWGFPKDEFLTTGHFPPQLYVREARRMRGEYIVTEADCRGETNVEDGIALGSYPMDSHQVSKYAGDDGIVRIEGAFWQKIAPYPISYRALVPKKSECENLLVPICLSATHAAYGSIRMEPVFMWLGQAAGAAAALSAETGKPVQDVDVTSIKDVVAKVKAAKE